MTHPEPHDLATLQALVRDGLQPKFIFFWGHTGKDPAQPGQECMSQWYPAPFTIDGVRYATAEHYMMAEKARLFGDEEAAQRVLAASHPSEVKNAGRAVRNFDDALWTERRFGIVVAGNRAKFGQNPALGRYLADTRGRILVEASPTDTIWGIGLAAKDSSAPDPLAWRGLNLLGFALMVVRAELAVV
ncbi:MAG: NADAR family protein [Minicystis sp.]